MVNLNPYDEEFYRVENEFEILYNTPFCDTTYKKLLILLNNFGNFTKNYNNFLHEIFKVHSLNRDDNEVYVCENTQKFYNFALEIREYIDENIGVKVTNSSENKRRNNIFTDKFLNKAEKDFICS
jgi:hypothetical protein